MDETRRDEAEATLSAIARRADLPFFRVDADRNVVEMSPALERLTGFQADDIVGRSCLRVHRCLECLAGCGVFDNGIVTDKSLELYRADGSLVRVRKSGRVFRDAASRITGAIEIVEPLEVEDRVPAPLDGAEARTPAEAVEIRRIHDALVRSRYNRGAAARELGISRTTLWRKMNRYGLSGR